MQQAPPTPAAFLDWVGQERSRPLATGALPATLGLLHQVQESLFEHALAPHATSKIWEQALRRMSRMEIIPYADAWEDALGPGVWTDGARIWVAQSSLCHLTWQSLVGQHHQAPEGMWRPWVWGQDSHRSIWSALQQVLVQAAGQSLASPPIAWPVRTGRHGFSIPNHALVRPGIVPWPNVMKSLESVEGARATIKARGWHRWQPRQLQMLESSEHPDVLALRVRWERMAADPLSGLRALNPWRAAHPRRWAMRPWVAAWSEQSMIDELALGSVERAGAVEILARRWSAHSCPSMNRLVVLASRHGASSVPHPAANGLARFLLGGSEWTWWRQSLSVLAYVRQTMGIHSAQPHAMKNLISLYRSSHRRAPPRCLDHTTDSLWRVGALLDEVHGHPGVPASAILDHKFFRQVRESTLDHSLFAHQAQQPAFHEVMRHWELSHQHGWPGQQVLLDLNGPGVQKDIRSGFALQSAIFEGAADDEVERLWRACHQPRVLHGASQQAHALGSLALPRQLLTLLSAGLPVAFQDYRSRTLLHLIDWSRMPNGWVRHLCHEGLDINAVDTRTGQTPLMRAMSVRASPHGIARALRAACRMTRCGAHWDTLDAVGHGPWHILWNMLDGVSTQDNIVLPWLEVLGKEVGIRNPDTWHRAHAATATFPTTHLAHAWLSCRRADFEREVLLSATGPSDSTSEQLVRRGRL